MMFKSVAPLIIFCVSTSALAQIALKAGMASAGTQRSLASGSPIATLLGIASSPMVLTGLALYFGSAIVWLFVLSRVEVSFAYPFVALGFVITALLGWLVFGDSFSAAKIVGTLLVAAGVVVMARG